MTTSTEPCRWVRGEELGHGSYAAVCKATVLEAPRHDFPTTIAVKTCESSLSDSMREEKRILDALGSCSQIVHCFGDCFTDESEQRLYNILLEFAPGGTLADEIKRRRGTGMPESDVRNHAKAILEGLSAIHANGFVHCDIKPENVLICDRGIAKIADFGTAKKKDAAVERGEVRGTLLYLAPESVNASEYEPPCDVWALGCVVSEMASGKSAWDETKNAKPAALLMHIGNRDDIPVIPKGMSKDGRDFLSKCFVKDPAARWTAQMLLSHPFISAARPLSTKKAVHHSPGIHFSFTKLGHRLKNLRHVAFTGCRPVTSKDPHMEIRHAFR